MKILPEIILASQSPRRKQLLEEIGLKFTCSKPKDNEPVPRKAKNIQQIRSQMHPIVVQKIRSLAKDNKNQIVIAADTLVWLDGSPLGKPKSHNQAKSMIKRLSGSTHQVCTLVVLEMKTQQNKSRSLSKLVTTKVQFRELKSQEINWYLQQNESMDKAGGYGIQGKGRCLIQKISGSFTNVVGLPVSETLMLLEKISGHNWIKWCT